MLIIRLVPIQLRILLVKNKNIRNNLSVIYKFLFISKIGGQHYQLSKNIMINLNNDCHELAQIMSYQFLTH